MQYINEDDWDSEYYRNDADIKEMNNYSRQQVAEDLELFLIYQSNKAGAEI